MSREANPAAQRHLADQNAGGVDTTVEAPAEAAVDHDPAPGQGRKGFRLFFSTLGGAFPDARLEPPRIVADNRTLRSLTR
jgi:hypothetical protein